MFYDELFPTTISAGISWDPLFDVDIVIEGGGHEQRNLNADQPLWRAENVAMACKDEAARADLIDFVVNMAGAAYSFAVKNHADYTVTSSQGTLSAIVASSTYQLQKTYTRGSLTRAVDVSLPKPAGVTLYSAGLVPMIEGGHYTLDDTSGIVTLIGSPIVIPVAWSGEYYLRCRFDTDGIRFTAATLEVFQAQPMVLLQMRYEQEES